MNSKLSFDNLLLTSPAQIATCDALRMLGFTDATCHADAPMRVFYPNTHSPLVGRIEVGADGLAFVYAPGNALGDKPHVITNDVQAWLSSVTHAAKPQCLNILVAGCNSCPFANIDNEYGIDGCHLGFMLDEPIELTAQNGFSIVPANDRLWKPINCPLKDSPMTVRLS